jgi:hypothetical protein
MLSHLVERVNDIAYTPRQSVSENARLCSGWALLLAAVCMPITIIILAIPVGAQSMIPPPIIDRELFFGDPEIVGAKTSTSTPSIRRIVWPRVRMFQPHAT